MSLPIQATQCLLDALEAPEGWRLAPRAFLHANGSKIALVNGRASKINLALETESLRVCAHYGSYAIDEQFPSSPKPVLFSEPHFYAIMDVVEALLPTTSKEVGPYLSARLGPLMWERMTAVSHVLAQISGDEGHWQAIYGDVLQTSHGIDLLLGLRKSLEQFFVQHEWAVLNINAHFSTVQTLFLKTVKSSHARLQMQASLAWAASELRAFGLTLPKDVL